MKALFDAAAKTITAKTNRVVEVTNLANRFGINLVNGKFDAGCPGVMNPLETVEIESSWGYGGANVDKTDRFNQFEMALKAAEAAIQHATYSNPATYDNDFRECRELFTSMNVYGRVMFLHIIKQSGGNVTSNVHLDVSRYASEGLDLNGTCNKNNIGEIFNHYIANPKVETLLSRLLQSKPSANMVVPEKVDVSSEENALVEAKETLTKEQELEQIHNEIKNLEVVKLSKFADSSLYYISRDKYKILAAHVIKANLQKSEIIKKLEEEITSANWIQLDTLILRSDKAMEEAKLMKDSEVKLLKDYPLFGFSDVSIAEESLKNDEAKPEKVVTEDVSEDVNKDVLDVVRNLIKDSVKIEEGGDKVITNKAFNWIKEIVIENNLDSEEFEALNYEVVINKTVTLLAEEPPLQTD